MIVPQTADCFRPTVIALRTLDEIKGVSFHTFSLPEDRCVRLLLKNVGRNTPEEIVREELETLCIRVQGVLQLRSGRRDQYSAQVRPLTPHFIVRKARGPEVAKVRSLTELCGLRISVETYAAPKRSSAVQVLPTFRPHPAILRVYPTVCCLWLDSPLRGVLHLAATT
jgi:hypothetical protein